MWNIYGWASDGNQVKSNTRELTDLLGHSGQVVLSAVLVKGGEGAVKPEVSECIVGMRLDHW